MTYTSIIIEGVDRLGKDSLINGIQNKCGFFQVMHFEKPKRLDVYANLENPNFNPLYYYQMESFKNMFDILDSSAKVICNRSHIGEVVYAPRYRGYSGNYVFDLEYTDVHSSISFGLKGPARNCCSNTLLVLLTTSDFSFIQDDGESFDFSKKEEEQEDFISAVTKSSIQNKLIIDVAKNGFYAPFETILDTVVGVYSNGLKIGTQKVSF
ncbi:hypothetical protein RsoM2USA_6 [Ralstonia phage RsoM2USA]|nr:hypothetical protein RsoM2USA_6 [Ralstonia phage RsoM2USA]